MLELKKASISQKSDTTDIGELLFEELGYLIIPDGGKNLMNRSYLFLLFGLSLMLLYGAMCPVLANAPATAKIVFNSTVDGNEEIYTMNPDGSQRVRLTHHPGRDSAPAWSPTGEQIVFHSDRDGKWDIYIMDADGTNLRRMFKTLAHREHPAWSPDGKWIAYTLLPEWAVYIAKIDGRDAKRIASTGWLGGKPAWSPNGTQIVFCLTQAIDPLSYQLQFANLQTGNRETIHPEPWLRMDQPTWSPNGNQIAFFRVPFLRRDINKGTIYTINRLGGELRRIVSEKGGSASQPAWSPDGEELLYQQKIGNHVQLFKINLRTGQTQKLTRGGHNYRADWFDPRVLPVQPAKETLTTTWAEVKKE